MIKRITNEKSKIELDIAEYATFTNKIMEIIIVGYK